MYLPPVFREDRIEVQHELIRAHPLGLIITSGPNGPTATPLPCQLCTDDGNPGTLRMHCARRNPLWQELQAAPQCLVVFQGPQHYITPSWYPTKKESGKVVPTWNYTMVQVRGHARIVDDTAWLRRHLADLTDGQENSFPAPWKVDDAPEDYISAQMNAIIGMEITIDRIEGKWKVSQNRGDADRKGVVDGLLALGEEGEPMANIVAGRIKGPTS